MKDSSSIVILPSRLVLTCVELRAYVSQEHVDIVHANLSHDHFTALSSLAFQERSHSVIRTDHKRDGTLTAISWDGLLERLTDSWPMEKE